MIDLNLQEYFDSFIQLTIQYAPRLVLALITLVVGLWLVKIITRLIIKTLKSRQVDPSLTSFLESFLSFGLKILVGITVASQVGVEMTSFVALLGAAGLAVGLALQGSLANFAGGILILIFKPFEVGDLIEAQGHLGRVKKITIISTTIITLDNKVVVIPNGTLSNDAIKNYSTEENLRVDIEFGIGYQDDIKKAKEVLLEVITADHKVLSDPPPFVGVGKLGPSSVDLLCRIWCKNEDYWDVYFEIIEQVKLAYDRNDISIPYPQRDIHIYQERD